MKTDTPGEPEEKWLTFQNSTPYETLNTRTPETKRIWVVFHGIGFLSRYFLRYFTHLDPSDNYIIAPQAPSLYYLDQTYRHVGASWLTREHTTQHMSNLLNYLDELYRKEALAEGPGLVLMGYSQGVSVMCRWIAKRKIRCDHLLLYSGKIPTELTPDDFRHLHPTTKVAAFIGDSDPYLSQKDRQDFGKKMQELFPGLITITEYHGGHELKKELINL